ncbi:MULTISPECIES: O-antigen ligase family protein [unclassified Blastococcus]
MIRSRLADAVGAGLALLLAGSVTLSAQVEGAGEPWPALATLAAAVLLYVAGRVLAPAVPLVVGVAVGATALVVAVSPAALSGSAVAPPLGYGNADAALYALLAGLAAIAAVTAAGDRWQTGAVLLVVALVLVTGLTGSVAGLVSALAVLAVLAGTLTVGRPARRTVLLAGVGLVLVTQLAVVGLAATHRPPDPLSPVHEVAGAALSERRLDLWSDAVVIAARHPVTGAGPYTFPTASPTARSDPDTRQAHSATLQMAAETGWPGAAALLGLLLWAVARPLLTAGRSVGAGVLAATAMASLAVQASVDYVLDFPVVVMTAALVLGVGTGAATARATVGAPPGSPRERTGG